MLIILEWSCLKALVLFVLFFVFNKSSLFLWRFKVKLPRCTFVWSLYPKWNHWSYLFTQLVNYLLLFWLESLKTIGWKKSLPWGWVHSKWLDGYRVALFTTGIIDLFRHSRILIFKFTVYPTCQLFLMSFDRINSIVWIFFYPRWRFILSVLFFSLKISQVFLQQIYLFQ